MPGRFLQAIPVVVLLAGQAQAQTTPAPQPLVNPGLISNENRRNEQKLREQIEDVPQGPAVAPTPIAPTIVPPSGGPTILLKSIKFDTSAFIPADELAAIGAPSVGKRVDASDIQRMVKAVNDRYAELGIVTASAYLPVQDLKTGELRIGLVEGRLDKVTVKGNVRLDSDYARRQVKEAPGDIVNVPILARNLATINKSGVAQIQASLQPGASFGLTEINLAVIEPPALSVNAFLDNQGTRSVGRIERGFLIQGYAPLGIDDRLTLYGLNADGNLNGNVAYSLPFNAYGGRVGASYSNGRINVVRGPVESLDITGTSQTGALNLSQPVFVDANRFFLLNAALSYGGAKSTQGSTPVTDNLTRKVIFGFSAGYSNDIFSITLSPTYAIAHTDFNLTDTSKEFRLYSGTVSSSLRLPFDFVTTLGGAFQASNEQLIAGDQLFQIGGPTTVRGFRSSGFSGASGYYANLELHHGVEFLLPGLDLFGFYDRGTVYGSNRSVTTLNSAGAGLVYTFGKRLVAEASVGIPLNRVTTRQAPAEFYFRLTAKFDSDDLKSLN